MSETALAPKRIEHDDIVYPSAIPFIIVHLACFAAIWTGVTLPALIVCFALYFIRMFAVTGGYHRYFSHRSYKVNRVTQFLLAFLCQTSAQRGALWWAAKHRDHHKYSDTPLDMHSPRHHGFWYSHFGWLFSKQDGECDYSRIKDLTRYPELMFLNKHRYTPAILLGFVVWLCMGWSGLVVGFLWSTVLLYHGTFCINSLAHVMGNQRYDTGDDSRNNFFLALITLGEGWHNNHHCYQTATRQGFYWWEIDITYYILKMLSWVGIVRDLREPPMELLEKKKILTHDRVEKLAQQLAESFPVSDILEDIRVACAEKLHLDELRERARTAWQDVESALKEVSLPQVPSMDDLRTRASAMFKDTPSLNSVAQRAHELIVAAVSAGVVGKLAPELGLAS